ncbi:hypothetical protein NDU88_003930 [Pleurodeles waltl]|uniref:Uncharacterized protein n=1 Tax=Pleurodeles waltl TaxID=8319 RepID=A0AAV7PDL4_PLEWA|nr:hypothetical protein NDU88_003930 [Pleurodeles waltl]
MEEGREGVVPGMEERREGVVLPEMEARIRAVLPGIEAWREGVVLSDLGKQVVLSKLGEAADCTEDGLALLGGRVVSASFSLGRGESSFFSKHSRCSAKDGPRVLSLREVMSLLSSLGSFLNVQRLSATGIYSPSDAVCMCCMCPVPCMCCSSHFFWPQRVPPVVPPTGLFLRASDPSPRDLEAEEGLCTA